MKNGGLYREEAKPSCASPVRLLAGLASLVGPRTVLLKRVTRSSYVYRRFFLKSRNASARFGKAVAAAGGSTVELPAENQI